MLKRCIRILSAAIAVLSVVPANAVETPVVPGTTTRTAALLNWLSSKEGLAIVSGQMEQTPDILMQDATVAEIPFNRIVNLTGKYPALRGFDFTFYSPDYISYLPTKSPPQTYIADALTQRAIDWFNNKGIVEISWHWFMKGGNGKTQTYSSINKPDIGTDFDISRAVITGTNENTQFLTGIDAIAVELKKLQTAGVPVLWRPLHEATGPTFWWGTKGPQAYKKAWEIMFRRLTGTTVANGEHGLKNLIWVFNPNPQDVATTWSAWYPGDEYVDIIAVDEYPSTSGSHGTYATDYIPAKAFAGPNKLVTLGENSAIPDPSLLASQGAKWMSFMTWSGEFATSQWNSDAFLTTAYNSTYVLTRDELPNWSTLSTPTVGVATKLFISRQPTKAFLGDSWPRPVYVAAVDTNNRIVRTKTGTVTLKKGSSSGSVITSATLVNGVAKFAPVFTTIATNSKVFASMTGLTSATTNSFNVGTATDTAKYTFESNIQGWSSSGVVSGIAKSTAHAYAGLASLRLSFSGVPSNDNAVRVLWPTPAVPAGATISMRIWIPFDSGITSINTYVQQDSTGNWKYTDRYYSIQQLTPGSWNTLSVTVPSDAASLYGMGLVFETAGTWVGDCYLDSVAW